MRSRRSGEAQTLQADAYVVACGSYSTALLRSVGFADTQVLTATRADGVVSRPAESASAIVRMTAAKATIRS